MKLRSSINIMFLILAICIIFPVVFIESLASLLLEHGCTNTACSPCLQIEAAKLFLKTLNLAGILFCAVYVLLLLPTLKNNIGFIFYPISPVLMKVRFNT